MKFSFFRGSKENFPPRVWVVSLSTVWPQEAATKHAPCNRNQINSFGPDNLHYSPLLWESQRKNEPVRPLKERLMIVNQKLRENSIHWPIKIPLIHSTNFEIVVKLNQPFFFLKKIKLLIKASGWMATPNKKIQFQQQQQQQQPKIRNTKIKWP